MRATLETFGSITDLVQGEVWSGPRLAAEVAARAALLVRLGVGPGAFVAIAHGGTPAFFADLFAAWSVGACAACLNPGLAAPELANTVDFIAPALVLVDADTPVDATSSAPLVCAGRERAAAAQGWPDCSSLGLDDPALVLFTSGTTGTPKGVVLSWRAVIARVALNRAHIGDGALAAALSMLPTHFGHGLIGNCLTPLFAGGNLLLYPEMGLKGAASLASLIGDHGVTFMSSTPALWKLVLKLSKAPPASSLRRVHIGSAPLSAELWRAVVAWSGTDDVVNTYGITEAANWVAGASAADSQPADGLVGAVWGGSVAVLGEDGVARGRGEGEILVRTPSLMTGYLHRPEISAEVLVEGWLRTGDLGRVDEDGTIRLLGRRGAVINRGGFKIHPDEVELLLERHPQVAEACVFALPDEISGEVAAAAVQLEDGASLAKGALGTWCAQRMRREAVPERWYFVARIPRTERGKLDRAAVRKSCLGGSAAP